MEQRQIFTGPPAAPARSSSTAVVPTYILQRSCSYFCINYCIDINCISKSGLLFVELQEYDPPVHHQHHCDPEPSPMSPISLITLDP